MAQEYSYSAISLFSGAGGDSLGLENAGYKVTHFSEFNETAIKTHLKAFPHSTLLHSASGSNNIKDIPDETFETLKGKVDIVFAGFPCQGFSHAGKKKSNDPRNELIHEFVRATKIIQPTWIIGENVKGLLSRNGVYPVNTPLRPVIDIIQELFENIGYKITYQVIDATEVGVPQHRKRLIIIGHKGMEPFSIPWAQMKITTQPPSIRSLLSSTLEGAMELPSLYKSNEQDVRFWIETTDTMPTGTPHSNLVRLVNGIRNLSTEEKKDTNKNIKDKILHVEKEGLLSFGVRKGGYHGEILDPDEPSKTIICTYNLCPRLFVGLHNRTLNKYWVRCLTPTECSQIQGFPADYPFQGSTKEKIIQIGNAVPPSLVTAVVNLIKGMSPPRRTIKLRVKKKV